VKPNRTIAHASRLENVTAVLGPTNTGKTHLAVERMLAHGGGMIGLPLRLLAREIYDRVRQRAGDHAVALVTGEEKIIPAAPRYWVSTVEAMPPDIEVPFLAIDEVQLCADFERGHIFTDRVLHRRGRDETMLLGAATAADLESCCRAPVSCRGRAFRKLLCRAEEDHPPAPPLGRRRVLG
jgi:ATP-dependent RNA helicase SUPV3L1/SUV3